MRGWRFDGLMIRVLSLQTFGHLWRRPLWIVPVLGPASLVFLLTGLVLSPIGDGTVAGQPNTRLFSGLAVWVLLSAALFTGAGSVKSQGGFVRFLSTGPASPAAVVLGKCLGAGGAALVPSIIFLLLAPLAGLDLLSTRWGLLLGVYFFSAVGWAAASLVICGLTANRGFILATMFLVILPLWLISGSGFLPHGDHLALTANFFNPVAYAVSTTRHALFGSAAVVPEVLSLSPELEATVVFGCSALGLASAVWVIRRIQIQPDGG